MSIESELTKRMKLPELDPSLENEESMLTHRANILQIAWAERSCSNVKEEERTEAIQKWLLSHTEWFNETVRKKNENRKHLLHDIDDATLDRLDGLYRSTSTTH